MKVKKIVYQVKSYIIAKRDFYVFLKKHFVIKLYKLYSS